VTDDTEAEQTHISDEMRALAGRELSTRVSYPVAESDIRRWALAVYYPEDPPAEFIDPEVAATTRHGGIVAPEDFNPFAWAVAASEGVALTADAASNPDSFEEALGATGPGLRNILNGGIELEYGVPVRPGDVITAVTSLDGYKERQGSLGHMLFTMMRTVWTNQDGEMVKVVGGTTIRY
jgi:acyl dehydratase